MTRPKLVALSGIDGAGKSTQHALLASRLKAEGWSPIALWSRGGYTPGINKMKRLARMLAGRRLPPPGRSDARDTAFGCSWVQRAWLTLAIADLVLLYGVWIRWLGARGKTVLCDRYLWDTLIDFRLAFPALPVEGWLAWRFLVWVAPRPDASVLLMIPLEESARRCDAKFEPFPDTPEMRARRFAEYERVSGTGCFVVLDGLATPTMIHESILGLIGLAKTREQTA